MSDVLTKEQRHKNMQNVRGKDTKPEIILRKKLWHLGYRYRKNYKELLGKPDIYLSKYKLCIFVDSEYFHGKDWDCTDAGYPSHKYKSLREQVEHSTHPEFWTKKIEGNISHDNDVDNQLRSDGYVVIRLWSKDVMRDPDACIESIKEAIFDSESSLTNES